MWDRDLVPVTKIS